MATPHRYAALAAAAERGRELAARAQVEQTEPEEARGPPPTLAALRAQGEAIRAIAARHRARAGVYGSVARGEAGPRSDLDLLVDLDEEASLWDLVHLEEELADLLGCAVGIRDARSLDPASARVDEPWELEDVHFAREVLRDAIAL